MKFPRLFRARPRAPRIELAVGDITRQKVDAIVNAAKPSLMGGGGVDGAIHRAGGPEILAQCKRLRETAYPSGLDTGDAVATTAGRLHASHVIHTVGPVYSATFDRSGLLRSAYRTSLLLADTLKAQTVAFPLISSGVYGWPTSDAIEQALTVFRTTRTRHVKTVRLVLFDARSHRIAMEMI